MAEKHIPLRASCDGLMSHHPSNDLLLEKHLDWLIYRNYLLDRLDSDEINLCELESICTDLDEKENSIIETKAMTVCGVLAKLILIAQLVAEGYDVPDARIRRILLEARDVVGIARVPNVPPETRGAVV